MYDSRAVASVGEEWRQCILVDWRVLVLLKQLEPKLIPLDDSLGISTLINHQIHTL